MILVALEAVSFLAIGVHNYLLYGTLWGHIPVRYDPEALFLMSAENPPSTFNSVSADPQLNRTIWMFGGSTVRGYPDRNRDKTLPALVSRYLNQRVRPYHVRVVNLGEFGFNSVLESKYLQKVFLDNQSGPDLVIFYDGGNDAFQFVEYRQPVGHIGYRRLKAFIESYRSSWFGLLKPINAAVYGSYTRELYDKLNLFFRPVEPDSPVLREMVNTAVRRYDHVARVVECYGSEFILVWQPLLWVEECTLSQPIKSAERRGLLDTEKFNRMRESVTTTYSALEKALQHKPYFVNLRDALCNRTVPVYWPDGIHLRYAGRRTIAHWIADIVSLRFPGRFRPRPLIGGDPLHRALARKSGSCP